MVINEAVELAKSYGGTDGHKYVNGVLDKLAAQVRPAKAEMKSRERDRKARNDAEGIAKDLSDWFSVDLGV